MNTLGTFLSLRAIALRIPRFLTVLTLALGLLALPMFTPADADAARMSERGAARACSRLGGSVFYNFADSTFEYFTMNCMSSYGNAIFSCGSSYQSEVIWCQ